MIAMRVIIPTSLALIITSVPCLRPSLQSSMLHMQDCEESKGGKPTNTSTELFVLVFSLHGQEGTRKMIENMSIEM